MLGFFLPKELNVKKHSVPRGRNSPCPWGSIACGHRGDASHAVSLGHVAGIPLLLSPGLRDKTGKEARPFGDHRWLEEGSASSGSWTPHHHLNASFDVPWIASSDPGSVGVLLSRASLTYSRRISMETILPLHPQPQFVCAGPEQKTSVVLQRLVHPCGKKHSVQWSPEPSSSLLIGNIFWQDKRERIFFWVTGADPCLEKSCLENSCCLSELYSHQVSVYSWPPMLN